MQIDHELVQKLAKLSRLDLTSEELVRFEQQLPPIVEYVGQLQNVKLEEVPPSNLPPTTMRPDHVEVRGNAKEILGHAPSTQDDFFKVDSVRSGVRHWPH